MLKEHKALPPSERYVRRAERIKVADEKDEIEVVICMYPAMSHLLAEASTLQSDTAHKRAKNWLEFELGAWMSDLHRGKRPNRIG